MSEVKLDSLVETYLALRNERDKLSTKNDEKDKE